MSELLNRFEIFSNISEKIKQKIKLFHVFNDFYGNKNALFITSDDKVFGFGYNTFGCCGLGHNSVVNEPQIIPELCHKNIQQFFIGGTFILGLRSDKQVYGWGHNSHGQLGRGHFSSTDYLKPKIITFSESVIQLSNGRANSLALTEEGRVYGWGSNEFGQIGCGKGKGDKITSPLHLDIFPQFSVKTIHCFDNQSYVVTTDGLVYSWGLNNGCSLGYKLDRNECVYEPKQILNIPKVISVCHSIGEDMTNTYFLTYQKQLYFCGEFKNKYNWVLFQEIPKLMNRNSKFKSLFPLNNYTFYNTKSLGVFERKVYQLIRNIVIETEYNSLFGYYCKELQISYKTIHLKSHQIFDGNNFEDLKNYIIFDKYFIICTEMGTGGFGTVFKVKDKLHRLNFAVKRIPLKGEN